MVGHKIVPPPGCTKRIVLYWIPSFNNPNRSINSLSRWVKSSGHTSSMFGHVANNNEFWSFQHIGASTYSPCFMKHVPLLDTSNKGCIPLVVFLRLCGFWRLHSRSRLCRVGKNLEALQCRVLFTSHMWWLYSIFLYTWHKIRYVIDPTIRQYSWLDPSFLCTIRIHAGIVLQSTSTFKSTLAYTIA